MPDLPKLFLRSGLIGFGAAAVFVGLLMAFNVVNLRHLVTHVEAGPFAAGIFWLGLGLLFGSVQIAYAVATVPERSRNR